MDILPTKWRQINRHLLLRQEQVESNQHPHFWHWGWAEWVTESSFLVESSIQLPSKAENWGLITTICLRAITLTKKMRSYKLLNRRNTRKTGQNDQILYHAWNSLSLNNLQCIQLTSQKVWDKRQGSYKLRLTLELDHRCMGPTAQRQCVNVSAACSPLTVQLHLGEFVGRLFLIWEFLYCQIYPFKIFLRQRKCNRKPVAY